MDDVSVDMGDASVDRVKLIFQATTVNLQLHCSVAGRRRRATEELVTLDKGLMTEALQAGQDTLEQVRIIQLSSVTVLMSNNRRITTIRGCADV